MGVMKWLDALIPSPEISCTGPPIPEPLVSGLGGFGSARPPYGRVDMQLGSTEIT